MEYRYLGSSDLKVSVYGLGTMTFGEQNSEAEAHAQLDLAVGRGVNLIDVAEMYPVPPRAETQGDTERFVGTWLQRNRHKRGELVVASKVTGPASRVTYLRGGPRLSADHITQALEGTLQRLQTDYLDLYQVHWPERSANYFGKLGYEHRDDPGAIPIAETLEALGGLVAAGKVRYIGVSNETPWGVMQYLVGAERSGLPRIVSIQNPYGLLNRSFEVGLSEMAHRENLSLLAYSPLGFGMLTGKYLDNQAPPGARLNRYRDYFTRYSGDTATAAARAYVELARRHGLSPTHLALAFIASRPFTGSVLVGATDLQQLGDNLDAAEVKLDPALLKEIEAIHRQYSNPCP